MKITAAGIRERWNRAALIRKRLDWAELIKKWLGQAEPAKKRLDRAAEAVRLLFWKWPVLLLFDLSCKCLLWWVLRAEPVACLLLFPVLTYIEAFGITLYFDDGIRGRRTGTLYIWQRSICSFTKALRGGLRAVVHGETAAGLMSVISCLLPPAVVNVFFLAPYFPKPFLYGSIQIGQPLKSVLRESALRESGLLLGIAVLGCVWLGQLYCRNLLALPGCVSSDYSFFWAGKESRRLLRGRGMQTFSVLLGCAVVMTLSTALLMMFNSAFLSISDSALSRAIGQTGAVSAAGWICSVFPVVWVTVCMSALPVWLYHQYREEEISGLYQQGAAVLQVYREQRCCIEELLQHQWGTPSCFRRSMALRNFFFKM